jgi:predicted metal-dependent hydrolase
MSVMADRSDEPSKVALHARNVKFDWNGLPFEWIPGQHFASHYINVLHLLLPEGERWFVKVFSDMLPMIDCARTSSASSAKKVSTRPRTRACKITSTRTALMLKP